jgi:hypothetical protein
MLSKEDPEPPEKTPRAFELAEKYLGEDPFKNFSPAALEQEKRLGAMLESLRQLRRDQLAAGGGTARTGMDRGADGECVLRGHGSGDVPRPASFRRLVPGEAPGGGRHRMKRALKWLLPALVAVEAVLVWSGLLELRDAVIVIAAVEVLLALVLGGYRRVLLVARRYRRARAEGLDAWRALEEALALILPRRMAKVVVLEPRLWVCLLRWASRRARPGEGDFSYHKRSLAGGLVAVVALTTPIELLIWEILVPWAWLRISLLILGIYALFWVFGF